MTNLYSQVPKYELKGQLKDTFSLSIPYHASIILLKNKDTISKGFSDNKGNFQLPINDSGSYQLYIYHSTCFPFADSSVTIKDSITDLGIIEMHSRAELLEEVIIKDNFTGRINKDTIEFTADSFLIKQFGSAKELLSKIPGIQIAPNGNITYNGKPISEVSLDGIPFLTMDPNKLLNILRGKDLGKIQLFDIKSLSARMTGIADNSRNTGLNLTLKEEAKGGYYGKLASGVGISKSAQWDNSGNVNSFNDSRRIMLFTDMNNTGGTSSISETMLTQPTSPAQNKPQAMSGGGHYDTRLLKNNRLSLNLDYTINRNKQDVSTTSNTNNLIPGNEFKTKNGTVSGNDLQIHNFNLRTDYSLSESAVISLTVNSNLNIGSDNSQNESQSYKSDESLLNTATTQTISTLFNSNTLTNLSYQKTFDKPGRALNISFTSGLNKNKTDIEQNSTSDFNNTAPDEKIRQKKNNDQSASNHTLSLHYTEPLKKGLNVDFSFIANTSNTLSNNITHDIFEDSGNLADSLNPLYSNIFNFHNIQVMLNTVLSYQTRKASFSLGGYVSQLNWNQNDLSNNNRLQKKYLNILPTANFMFKVNYRSMISANFSSQVSQPELNQIQPVINNNNPLYIMIGNRDLTQSRSYNFSLNYNNINPSINQYFNVNASFALIQNAISLKQYFNAEGKAVSQYYNVNGNYNTNLSANYNRKLFSNAQLILAEDFLLTKNINTLNGLENHITEQQYRSSISFIYTIDTLLDISYSFTSDYSSSNSSLIDNSKNKTWNTIQNLAISYNLPQRFSIGSIINWNLRPKTSQAQALMTNVLLWNFSINKTLGKKDAFTIKLIAYDLMNQNKSYSIYYGPNIQSETRYKTIGRYAMLGLIWNFTKREHRSDL